MDSSVDDCARELLDVMMSVMRAAKDPMRDQRPAGLTVPQFRALLFLRRLPGAALKEVAFWLGLSASTSSNVIDSLADRGLVRRESDAADRRRLRLDLTTDGEAVLDAHHNDIQAVLAQRLATLTPSQRDTVWSALRCLGPAFGRPQAAAERGPGD